MSNSEVLLGQIMEAVETEELLKASEIKSIEKLILSGDARNPHWGKQLS